MPDLRSQLNAALKGRVCLVGIGNVEQGDDGFGVRLAEALAPLGQSSPWCCIVVAGTSPEAWVNRLGHFDHVIFLDAVDFSGMPGSVVFLDAGEMAARFPQVSTHKLSLSVLAKWVEANGTTKAWLLGVQPESLQPGAPLPLNREGPARCADRTPPRSVRTQPCDSGAQSASKGREILSPMVQASLELLHDLLVSLIAHQPGHELGDWPSRMPVPQREPLNS